MRIFGHMVTHNEADRYLAKSLCAVHQLVDDLHVYDDRSDDDTTEIARNVGCEVTVRGAHDTAFLEDESTFRFDAWQAFEEVCRPQPGDWVVIPDADEFFIVDNPGMLQAFLQRAEDQFFNAVRCPVYEIFGQQDGQFQRRVDGYWSTIEAVRAVRWQPGGVFAQRKLAGGSVPTYAQPVLMFGLPVAHFGYYREADRQARYTRYAQRPGHKRSHIESILREPTLEPIKNWWVNVDEL